MAKVFFQTTALFVLLASALALSACGKAGMPSPKNKQDSFSFSQPQLTLLGECLVARGNITGATDNLESITLEVAPILSYDDCPGCPFVAQERGEFSSAAAHLDPLSGEFMFSFCPETQAPMYRWRLVGKNVFRGLPNATTTPQIINAMD